MNIAVLNGSPKGDYSATLQTVKYLEILNPDHTFETVHVGARIKALEKDFSSAADVIKRADMILFSYPVYTFIAPSQLHRFIELLKESGLDLCGKFAAQITTSKHFYDVTAHKYIEENCRDLNLKYLGGLSADMDDLTTRKGQNEAEAFFKHILWKADNEGFEPSGPAPTLPPLVPACAAPCTSDKKPGEVVIVADIEPDSNLGAMIERFRAVVPYGTRVVNLREFPFKGGCLGCFNCAVSGKCVYTDRFDDFLRSDIQKGSRAIVYAFSIKDHSMGSLMKLYDDRQFCNGHRTVTSGMPVGYIISGHLSCENNLRMVIEGRSEVGGNYLASIACDEFDTDSSIDRMARTLDYAIENAYTQPANFLGVGGMKIFRDLIYMMRGMMKADHRFYKEHGIYDFPHKQKGTILKMYLVGALLSLPSARSKMGNKMTEGMIAPYKKALEEARKRME